MAEIAPGFIHPALHKTIAELLAEMKPGIRIEKCKSKTGKGKD
jgi:hypothetical protein